jgi:murein DD-endopeptidase MepM/ murein hydrolase activator NlpD
MDSAVYPVNRGNMNNWIDANPFQKWSNTFKNRHQGSDLTKLPFGNNDYGDTVYSIGNGKVILVGEVMYEGKHKVEYSSIIMILHKTIKYGYVVSLYRHCQQSLVKEGDYVRKLQPLSTIGTDFGLYEAHLHFEIRNAVLIGTGGGYGNSAGFLDPMKFIAEYNK